MLELKYHLLLAATGCKISNSVQRTHCKINQNAARRQNEILTRAIATSIVTYRVCVFFLYIVQSIRDGTVSGNRKRFNAI